MKGYRTEDKGERKPEHERAQPRKDFAGVTKPRDLRKLLGGGRDETNTEAIIKAVDFWLQDHIHELRMKADLKGQLTLANVRETLNVKDATDR